MIISLAVFACVERDCFSLSGQSLYVIENTTNEENSDNSITPHSDLSEVDVTLAQSLYFFDLKNLSSDKVNVLGSFFPQNLYFYIWQPPKIS